MPEYKTYILKERDIELWDEYIEQSTYSTIFHKLEWLKAAEEHSKMQFIPVAINKGRHIICMIPFFLRKKYGLRVLMSPPNSCAIPYLGPVLNIISPNRYNYERTYLNVINEITMFAERQLGFDYFRMIHVPGLSDMRPYIWRGYSIESQYTYRFDLLEGIEKIYNNFHTTAKNKIRKAKSNNDMSISRDKKYAYSILNLVEKRYLEQKKQFKVGRNYFENLKNSSFSSNIETMAIIHDERVIAGDITLTDENKVYEWVGTVSREGNLSGMGELMLWEKLKEITARGFSAYDMVGANTQNICKHKGKYGANLENYYNVYKTSKRGKLALKLMNIYGKVYSG